MTNHTWPDLCIRLLSLVCVLVGCSFRADVFDDFTGLECGFEATDTIELQPSRGCWTISGVDRCIPTTQSPCEGPQRPIWRPGTELTLWCPVGVPKEAAAVDWVECEE